jgi:hypothetical protein
MNNRFRLKTAAAAILIATASSASAESNFQTGAGALSATAKVDFTITIPKILYLRVGAGTAYPLTLQPSDGTVNLITFTPAAAVIGNGVAQSGTGGDLTGGVVTAAVIGNGGVVTLSAAAPGTGLTDGGTNAIPYSEIATAAAAQTVSYSLLAAPVLVNGTSANVSVPVNGTTKVVTADAKWTYTYKNTTVPSAGTYGGVNTNGGRVTYTAALP